MRKFVILFAIVTLLLSPIPKQHTYAAQGDLIVAAELLHMRQGPGLSYPIILSLKRDQTMQSIRTEGDWIEVNYDGQTGWVASWLTKKNETNAASATKAKDKTVISQVDRLNLRAEPSLSASVHTQLSAGMEGRFIQQQGDWVQIEIASYTGWVSTSYVSIIDEATKALTTEKQPAQPAVSNTSSSLFTVNVDVVNVRKKPSLEAKKLGLAKRGQQFKVISRENNWVQVEYTEKENAWIYSFYGTFSNASTTTASDDKQATGQVMILHDGTNVREQATTSSNVVYRANAGETFAISTAEGEWYKIKLTNGDVGYIANWVVTTDKKATPAKKKEARKKGSLKGLTIVIDPGHGGNDSGTTGKRGTAEKEINLLTAEALKAKLRSAGATVILTRESDEYVDLRSRVSMANSKAADAFISIHYDATDDTSISGFTTYYMGSAQKELGEYIHAGLEQTVELRSRGVQPGNYLVLRENRLPSVLLELGYLSNSNEERKVTTAKYREQATLGIYKGLLAYFDNQLSK